MVFLFSRCIGIPLRIILPSVLILQLMVANPVPWDVIRRQLGSILRHWATLQRLPSIPVQLLAPVPKLQDGNLLVWDMVPKLQEQGLLLWDMWHRLKRRDPLQSASIIGMVVRHALLQTTL